MRDDTSKLCRKGIVSTIPRGGDPDPIDGAGAVVVPIVVLAAVLAAALLAVVL